jgi:hypothetical protein
MEQNERRRSLDVPTLTDYPIMGQFARRFEAKKLRFLVRADYV